MSFGARPSIPATSFSYRARFYNAKKNSSESIADWYNRLLSMAGPCQFGFAASLIILDKFVFGLEDKYRKQLSDMGVDITLEQSIKIARQLEVSSYQNQFESSAFSLEPNCDIRGVEDEDGCPVAAETTSTCDNRNDTVSEVLC